MVQQFVDEFIVPTYGTYGSTRNYLLERFNEFLQEEAGEEMSKPIDTSHSTFSTRFDEQVDKEATVKNVKAWLTTDYLTLVDRADNSYLYAKGYRVAQSNNARTNNGNTTDERYIKQIDAKKRLEFLDQWIKNL